MNHSKNASDDELGLDIREAFENQPIPERPSDDFLTGLSEKPKLHAQPSVDLRSRWTHVAASIPAIVASVFLVVALWRMNQPVAQTPPKIQAKHIDAQEAIAQEQKPTPEPDTKSPTITTSADESKSSNKKQRIDYPVPTGHSVDSIAETLSKFLGPSDTLISANKNTNQLSIEASTEQHDSIAKFLEKLKAPKDQELRSYFLKFADAAAAVKALNVILDDPNTRIQLDIRTNRLVVQAPKKMQKRIEAFIAKIDVKEGAPNILPEQEPAGKKYSATEVLRFFNASIRTKRFDPESLAALVTQDAADKRANFERAFRAVGIPKGILHVQVGLSKTDAWIAGENDDSFTYTIDPKVLLAEFGVGLDIVLGDSVFHAMLDGVKEDPEGPKIDIRALLNDLSGRVVISVHGENQLLVGLSLKNEDAISRAVERAISADPDGFVSDYKKVRMNVILPPDQDQPRGVSAFCVTNGYFLIGDNQLARQAIDRIAK